MKINIVEKLKKQIGDEWFSLLEGYFDSDDFDELLKMLRARSLTETIYPSQENRFRVFKELNPSDIKVVILGQDPYYTPKSAIGRSFAVPVGGFIPPSLKNIFKQLNNEKIDIKTQSDLEHWSKQGVFLLNTSLTVEHNRPNIHAKHWENFTKTVIIGLNKYEPVYLLWGANAKSYSKYINNKNNILESNHPSPMSANKGGWFGNNHFTKCNELLTLNNKKPIEW